MSNKPRSKNQTGRIHGSFTTSGNRHKIRRSTKSSKYMEELRKIDPKAGTNNFVGRIRRLFTAKKIVSTSNK